MEKMVPMETLTSTLEEPSRGSRRTMYLPWQSLIWSGIPSACSSEPMRQTSPPRRRARTNSSWARTSSFCCTSPCTFTSPDSPSTSTSPAFRTSRVTILAAMERSRMTRENWPVEPGTSSCRSMMNCSSVLNEPPPGAGALSARAAPVGGKGAVAMARWGEGLGAKLQQGRVCVRERFQRSGRVRRHVGAGAPVGEEAAEVGRVVHVVPRGEDDGAQAGVEHPVQGRVEDAGVAVVHGEEAGRPEGEVVEAEGVVAPVVARPDDGRARRFERAERLGEEVQRQRRVVRADDHGAAVAPGEGLDEGAFHPCTEAVAALAVKAHPLGRHVGREVPF